MREELNELQRLIDNNGDASEALRELKRCGLDTEVVLEDLFLFCGGTAEEVRAQLEEDKRFRDELLDLETQLKRLAGRVRRIVPKIEEHLPIQVHVPRKDNLSQRLRAGAHFYRGLVAAFYAPYLKNVRIGGKEDRKANITSGRDHHLLHLIYLVSKAKKPKPQHRVKNPILEHYMLVARLVAAVMGDKRDLNRISDSLRKKFERFASKGSEKDRQRLELDKGTIEVSVREELKKLKRRRRAQAASRKDTSRPKKV